MKIRKTAVLLIMVIWLLGMKRNAWGSTIMSGGRGIRIGIIDTGVTAKHDAFGEGQLAEGINLVFPEHGTEDKIGHGTRIASLIAGTETERGTIEGTAPEASVVPLVYQSLYPSGVTKNGGVELLAQAIVTAIDDYGCRVLCISSGINTDEEILRDAVEYAEKKEVIVVAAVGNDNERNPEKIYYPAAYETVIGIGALDENNKIAEFSQRHGVFAAVRGENVRALSLDGTLKKFSGTSYAAACAAGISASLLSEAPDSTPEEIRRSVALSAEDLGEPGYDADYGWGKINAGAALTLLKSNKLFNGEESARHLHNTYYYEVFIPAQRLLYKAGSTCLFHLSVFHGFRVQ